MVFKLHKSLRWDRLGAALLVKDMLKPLERFYSGWKRSELEISEIFAEIEDLRISNKTLSYNHIETKA